MVTEQSLQNAINASVAKQILDGLDNSHRDELLQKTLERVLKDYDFRGAVGKVVSEKAIKVASELAESEEWESRIKQAIKNGFNRYINKLEVASENLIKRVLHGTRDGYNAKGPHELLMSWPEEKQDA